MTIKRLINPLTSILAITTLCIFSTATGYAASNDDNGLVTNQDKASYKGSNVGAGLIINTGNTNSRAYNAAINILYSKNRWGNTAQATYQRAQSESAGVTANRLYLKDQIKYTTKPKNFVFLQGDYTKDQFDGYVYVANLNLGHGWDISMPKDMTWSLFLGPGLQSYRKQNSYGNGPTKTEFSALAGTQYNWNINDKSSFSEDISVNHTKDNTHMQAVTALTTMLMDKLSFQTSFTALTDSKPLTNKHVNTITTLQMVYTF